VRLYLARHGQTAYNALGRFQGHGPVPLDDTGREQARDLAARAAQHDWAAFYCSPLERARETAGIVAQRIGMEPVEDARFAETDCGDWTDRTFEDVIAEDAEGFAAFVRIDLDFRFPGGESFTEQRDRVREGIADVRRGPLPALVVCHQNVIRLGLDLRDTEIPNAALVEA
jgi:broad specificity phosphatase PhoE